MENTQNSNLEQIEKIYQFVLDLKINKNKTTEEITEILTTKGFSYKSANNVVLKIMNDLNSEKKRKANNDIIQGVLWLAGGVLATAMDIGFIFYGAIIFGIGQFSKGIYNKFTTRSIY